MTMLIKTRELCNERAFINHAILDGISATMNKDDIDKIIKEKTCGKTPNEIDNTEYDVKMLFEGVEIDISTFFKLLENSWNAELERVSKENTKKLAGEMFEKFKHEYLSKNSVAAKADKLKAQLEKCTNIMKNIETQLR